MPASHADAAIERARQLVGVRFRPQGRSHDLGLDCVGLGALAYGVPVQQVRSDYRLHGAKRGAVEAELARFFAGVTSVDARLGDLLLVEPGFGQLHLILLSGGGYIHADAGLRRVVEVPGPQPFRLLSAWRYPKIEKAS